MPMTRHAMFTQRRGGGVGNAAQPVLVDPVTCRQGTTSTAYYPKPWVEAPPGREPFDELGSVALPVAPSVETIVHQFQVPLKFDGVIFGILTRFIPGSLSPGSGDIVWRVRHGDQGLQGEPVRNFAAITAEFGDFTHYHDVWGGIEVKSREFITLTVTHVAGALPAGPLTVMAVNGYYYPDQRST